MEKEFIVWGVAPNGTEEQVLYTKCTNLDMANNCAAYLVKEKDNIIDANIISPKCRKARWLMVERLDQAMEQNQNLVHKLDDHLTDIRRGYKLNG